MAWPATEGLPGPGPALLTCRSCSCCIIFSWAAFLSALTMEGRHIAECGQPAQQRHTLPVPSVSQRVPQPREGLATGDIHCLLSAFCILSFSLSCGVSLGWGRGRDSRRWVSQSAPGTPQPRAWRLQGCGMWRGGRVVLRGSGLLQPSVQGEDTLSGAAPPLPSGFNPLGWIPAHPGTPAGPPGPALGTAAAGIRRASSKFLLTLAAPVSLPAAGSVLDGWEKKAVTTWEPTASAMPLNQRVRVTGLRCPRELPPCPSQTL